MDHDIDSLADWRHICCEHNAVGYVHLFLFLATVQYFHSKYDPMALPYTLI